MEPMLASPTDPKVPGGITEALGDGWVLQQKLDGERLLVVGDGAGQVEAFNRNGRPTAAVPAPVLAAVAELKIPVAFDGERVGGQFVAFDLPMAGAGTVLLSRPLTSRLETMDALLGSWAPGYRHRTGQELPILRAQTAFTPDEKRAMLDRVAAARGEGWVAKRLASTYQPGVRSLDWRKIKRVRDIDCVVEWIGDGPKQNMGLTLYRDGVLVDGGYGRDGRRGGVGECGRLTGDGQRVKEGDVVTVQILNVTDSDRLFQPTRPRIRTDKAPEECTWDQLEPLKADRGLVLAAGS